MEQCNEWPRDIYIIFVDFERAFDSVHRGSLRKILRHYGIPAKFTNIISQFYNNVSRGIQSSSLKLVVKSDVRQSCAMSAFLIIVIIDWLMKNVTKQQRTGIRWKLCTKFEDFESADDNSSALTHPNPKCNIRA